jgi:phosphatidate cytidylyltransferase
VSRRDDREGHEDAGSDAAAAGGFDSPEDEFRDWLDATSESGAPAAGGDAAPEKGWLARMFGKPGESEEDVAEATVPAADSERDDGDTEAAGAEEDISVPRSFGEMWRGEAEDDEEPAPDFDQFTSNDYVQATTREYAGLAEAVAKAEEETPQQIAVSAEIRGLESGLVGLDDVVSAAGGSTDVIEPPATSDLALRVLTAVGLLALFGASLLAPAGIGALIIVVLGLAAGEMYTSLIRHGYRPLALFGFLTIAGAFLGTWAWGPVAIPISLLLGAIAVFLFYATVPGRTSVLENASLTIMVAVWIGGCGGFAFDIIEAEQYRWLILGLVVTVAFMDIVSYFVGRRIGRRPLAPVISPKKTVEGYVAGLLAALAAGAAFGSVEPFDLTTGLVLGAVVAVVAPVGDLAVSVLKRAIGVKDMGVLLPGHGGILDRVDAMIITIPALWLAYSWMGLLN